MIVHMIICSLFSLQDFRQATLFPTFARSLISDFAVLLSIVIFVGVDMLIGINTPKLVVPSEFKVTFNPCPAELGFIRF